MVSVAVVSSISPALSVRPGVVVPDRAGGRRIAQRGARRIRQREREGLVRLGLQIVIYPDAYPPRLLPVRRKGDRVRSAAEVGPLRGRHARRAEVDRHLLTTGMRQRHLEGYVRGHPRRPARRTRSPSAASRPGPPRSRRRAAQTVRAPRQAGRRPRATRGRNWVEGQDRRHKPLAPAAFSNCRSLADRPPTGPNRRGAKQKRASLSIRSRYIFLLHRPQLRAITVVSRPASDHVTAGKTECPLTAQDSGQSIVSRGPCGHRFVSSMQAASDAAMHPRFAFGPVVTALLFPLTIRCLNALSDRHSRHGAALPERPQLANLSGCRGISRDDLLPRGLWSNRTRACLAFPKISAYAVVGFRIRRYRRS